MNTRWSLLLSLSLLFILAGCGKEQFGSAPQSTGYSANSLTSYSANSCSNRTLIKPKVDVLYVVDNSGSSYYISQDIKSALANTVSTLSKDFDYRVIGTPLIESSTDNQDYQVLTNSTELTGINPAKLISTPSQFSFFTNTPIFSLEEGLGRTVSFINFHKNNLIRNNSYLIIVLVSNGRDEKVSYSPFGDDEKQYPSVFAERLASFKSLGSQLNSIQLRLISVTAKRPPIPSSCPSGWKTSDLSYAQMAKELYAHAIASGAVNNSPNQDSYNLCTESLGGIFTSINNSIKQVLLPHEYRYAPITFAKTGTNLNWNSLEVKRINENGSSTLLTKDVHWTLHDAGSDSSVVNLRVGPNPIPGIGEPATGRYFVKFTDSNILKYPDCVTVTSVSKTEYFQYIVLPQKPQPGLSVRINGNLISQSSSNGWSDETASAQTLNIKANYPNPGDNQPPIMRTGFMLKLNGVNNYYKSGDNVQVNYVPAGI